MGTQIRVKMEELQSIFQDTKNALALGSDGAALMGREPPEAKRKSRSAADPYTDGALIVPSALCVCVHIYNCVHTFVHQRMHT